MPDETKIVITLKGTTAAVGIQRTNCDPAFFKVEGDLAAVVANLNGLMVQAASKWEANPRYPKSKLPPAAPQPQTTASAARPQQPQQPAAPKVNAMRPMF